MSCGSFLSNSFRVSSTFSSASTACASGLLVPRSAKLVLVLSSPWFGGLGVGSLLPAFACLLGVTSSFFLVVFSSVSCVSLLSWFPCRSLLLSRVACGGSCLPLCSVPLVWAPCSLLLFVVSPRPRRFSRSFFRLSRASRSSLGFRVAPSSFLASPVVALASPFVRFPWCGPPAPFFCSSFLRVLVVFLALFFVCLVRLAPLSLSVSLPPPSRAATRSKRLFPAPFGLAFLSFLSVSPSGLV